jgi:hypothetical protein
VADVWGKLNLKDQSEILVVNAPPSFESQIKALDGVTVRRRAADVKRVDFSLAFVTKQKEVDDLAKIVGTKAQGDAVVWFAYPKGTSKKYTCEFNRDTGFQPLGDAGFEPVRMVAIDEDWTAMRVRRVEFIKNLTRPESFALSKEGKKRTARR